MDDLSLTEEDCVRFRAACERYSVNLDTKEKYNMGNSTTKAKFLEVIKDMSSEFRHNPDSNYLICYCFAGHGM